MNLRLFEIQYHTSVVSLERNILKKSEQVMVIRQRQVLDPNICGPKYVDDLKRRVVKVKITSK
jgi:hypothetical protein